MVLGVEASGVLGLVPRFRAEFVRLRVQVQVLKAYKG